MSLAKSCLLVQGQVLDGASSSDKTTVSVARANRAFRTSTQVTSLCLNLGDGYTILLKNADLCN